MPSWADYEHDDYVIPFKGLALWARIFTLSFDMWRRKMRNSLIYSFTVCLLLVWTSMCAATDGPGHICFRRIDANKDSRVTFEEFAVHYGKDEAAFKAGDANGDGWLTHDEYHDFLGHGAPDKSVEK
jgi:hypothetical protein